MINPERFRRNVIVIAGSTGGMRALLEILTRLERLDATFVTVLHRSSTNESQLAALLAQRAKLPVSEPATGDVVERGRLYLAPRDQHVVFDAGRFLVHRGVKEHYTRPAADPLFRSAAHGYGRRVVAVVLSGNGYDAVAGSLAVKMAGGLVLVQSPDECEGAGMPANTSRFVDVDAVLPVAQIADVVTRLALGEALDLGAPLREGAPRPPPTPGRA